MSRILHPPKAWNTLCRTMILWHGCCRQDGDAITAGGVDPSRGRADADFGVGFYTTTFRRQAEKWAWQRYSRLPPDQARRNAPVIIRFALPLERLGPLNSLHFVSETSDEQQFWSLVHFCRQGGRGHMHPARVAPNDWYDVVSGPVAAFWEQCVVMKDADQYSFHTLIGATVLNELIRSGESGKFRVIKVRKRR
jgi:hypothetical protein